jgi:serine/threonine-protein kinase RsbW
VNLLSQVRTQVKTDLNSLGQVLAWFDQFASPVMPRAIWLQCQIALAEAFTNTVRYAHFSKPADTPIEIEVTFSRSALEIRIWDYGSEFDLENFLQKAPPVSDQAEGGRGLRLMERIADGLAYRRTEDQRNCLLIVKNIISEDKMLLFSQKADQSAQ